MSNRKSYFNGELGQRFGYRKLTVGLCSVVLGSFLLTTNNQQVKADATDDAGSETEHVTSTSGSNTNADTKPASVIEETKPASTPVSKAVESSNTTQQGETANTTGAQNNGVAQNNRVQNGITSQNANNTQNNAVATPANNTNSQAQNNVGTAVQNGDQASDTNTLNTAGQSGSMAGLAEEKITNTQTQNNADYTQNKIEHINKGSQTFTSTEVNNANGDWHVKYVDENGKAVADGKDINISSAVDNGKYSDVPNGYVLNNPDGTYSIVNQGALPKDTLKGNIISVPATTKTIHHHARYSSHTYTTCGNSADDKIFHNLYDKNGNSLMKVGAKIWVSTDTVCIRNGSEIAAWKLEDEYDEYNDGTSTSRQHKSRHSSAWDGDESYYDEYNDGRQPRQHKGSHSLSNESRHKKHWVAQGTDTFGGNGSGGLSQSNINTLYQNGDRTFRKDEKRSLISPAHDEVVSNNDGYDKEELPIAFVNEQDQIVGQITTKTGKVGTTDNVSLTLPYGYKLASDQTMPKTVTYSNDKVPVLINVVSDGSNNTITNPSGKTIHVNFVDQNTGKKVGDQTIDLNSAEEGTNFYQTPNGWATDNNGRYDVGTPFSRGYLTITDDKGNNVQNLVLNAKQAQDFFEAFRKGNATDLNLEAYLSVSHSFEINLQDLAYNGVSTYDKENGDRSWENIVYNATKKVIQTETNRHMTDNYGDDVFDGYYGKITAKRYNAYTFTDNYHSYDASTNTVTVPVHQASSSKFIDNSNNVVSTDTYSHTLTVSVLKPYDTQATAVDFIDTDVDAQKQGAEVGHTYLPAGKVGSNATQTVDASSIISQIPAGYELADGFNIPTTVNLDGKADSILKINLKHAVSKDPVKTGDDVDTKDKTKGTVKDSDLSYSLNRTIHIVGEPDSNGNQHNRDVQQTVTFSRVGYRDMVTGLIKWQPYMLDTAKTTSGKSQFDAVSPDSKWTADGSYTATTTGDTGEVQVTTATKQDTIHDGTITYVANNRTLTINFIDTFNNANKTISSVNKTAKANTDVALNDVTIPTGYVLADGQASLPATYHLTTAQGQHIDVKLTHGYSKTPINNGELTDPTLGDRDFTRVITISSMPGQKDQTITQHVHFHRDGLRDLTRPDDSTAIKWGDWQTTGDPNFVGQTVNPVAGYTMTVDGNKQTTPVTIPTINVTVDTPLNSIPKSVAIAFSANPQTVTYHFVDDNSNGATVGKDVTLNGVTGQNISFNLTAPEHYVLADGTNPAQSYTFTANNTPLVFHLKHKIDNATSDQAERATATRTVTVTKPDKTVDTYVQTIGLMRDTHTDEVTGKITKDPWQIDDKHSSYTLNKIPQGGKSYTLSGGQIYFAGFDLPNINGYTPKPAKQINGTQTALEAINNPILLAFFYDPNEQSVIYNFVDDNDPNNRQTVESINKTGVTGGQLNFNVDMTGKLAGYTLENPSDAQQNYTFGAENPARTIYLKHGVTGADKDHIPAGYTIDDFEHTVNRIVNITTPDGKTNSTKQSHTFTRDGKYDAVTKQVAFNPWSDGDSFTFNAVPIPTEPGYKASGDAPAATVHHDTGDSKLDITFKALGQSVTVNYVDANGTPVKTMTITGSTGQTIDLGFSQNMPENWITSDPQQKSSYTFSADNSQVQNIKIEHKTRALNDDTKTVTRQITVYLPGHKLDSQHSTTQSATFKRSAKYDYVLGRNVYGSWSAPQTLPEIDLPAIEGYETPNVPSVPVTAEDSSTTLTAEYTPKGQNVKITYTDGDGNQIGDPQIITGKTGEDKQIDYQFPKNWEAIDDSKLPKDYHFSADPDDNKPISVTIKHKLADPKNESVTVTRDVEIDVPNGQPQKVHQTVTFTRTNHTDLVTGKVTNGAWSENGKHTFDKVDVPVVNGYAPSQTVPAIIVTADKGNQNMPIKITYIAGGQTNSYQFVDDDENGKAVNGGAQFAGKTGETVQLHIDKAPDGYDFSRSVPGSYTFKAEDNQPLTIHLKHHLIDATSDPSAETSRVFTRNITITDVNSKVANITQTVKFTRSAQKDAVTDEYKYGNWNNDGKGQFGAYPVKSIDGYSIINKDNGQAIDGIPVLAIDADKSNKITNVNISYKALDQSASWQFRDDDNKSGKPSDIEGIHNITGKTGESVDLSISLPENYVVKGYSYGENGQMQTSKLPSQYKFAGKDNLPLIIHLAHKTADVSTANGDKGVDDSRTITRTVVIESPNGKETTEKQSVVFTRPATKDLVTGNINYGKWNHDTQQMPEMTLPVVPGYSQDVKVPEITVTPDSKPSSITVHYTANDGQQTIIYQDKNGKELGQQVVKGKTDENVPFTPDFPKGYINKEVPKTITIPAVDKPITINVDPVVTTVHIDPNHPVEKGDIIPGTDVTAPSGIGKNDLNKDITRHIVISLPDGTSKTIDQTVHAQRGATIDLNTKKITYDPWKVVGKDSFDPIEVPKVDGYTPNISEIPGIDHVDPNKDYGNELNVKVTYTRNKVAEKTDNGDSNDNGGYIDNSDNTVSVNTDPSLNNGTFSGLSRSDLSNSVGVKAGQGRIKHHKSDSLNKALLKKGRKHDKRNGRNGRNGSGRGYGYGHGYGQNGSGYDNYGTGNGNINGISSGTNGYNANGVVVGDNANDNNGNDTNTSSSLMNAASGQYGNSNLPQTGNNRNYAVIALGLATIAMSFGLAYREKRHN